MKPAPVLRDVVEGWPVYTARRPAESRQEWQERHWLACEAYRSIGAGVPEVT